MQDYHDDKKASRPPAKPIIAAPYRWCDGQDIKPRDWIYGSLLLRGSVTLTIAPGGVGKSSLVISETVALVTGRDFLGYAGKKPYKIWLWNLEDAKQELQRRIQAVCQHFKVHEKEIEGRLFINSGLDQSLCVTSNNKGGFGLNDEVIQNLKSEIRNNNIDVLIIDPFVSSHSLNENDNNAMDLIIKEWSSIAFDLQICVHIIHHTRKATSTGQDSATESARGGGALTDGARIVRVLNRVQENALKKLGVDNPRSVFSAGIDKANFAEHGNQSDYYQIKNVHLSNGDSVGVVERFYKSHLTIIVSDEHKIAIQNEMHNRGCRKDPQSPDWVGNVLAAVFNFETKKDKQHLIAIQKHLTDDGYFRIAEAPDAKGRLKEFIEVGEPL